MWAIAFEPALATDTTDGYRVCHQTLIPDRLAAIFALVNAPNPDAVAKRFAGYGGQVLRSTLSPTQAAKLQETIRG